MEKFRSDVIRFQVYPNVDHYKLVSGHCFLNGFADSRFFQDLIREKFSKLSASEREHLVKKHEEGMTKEIAKNINKVPEKCMYFFYEKVKYMQLTKGDYGLQLPLMTSILRVMFSSGKEQDIAPLCVGLPVELSNNIFEFNRYVRGVLR